MSTELRDLLARQFEISWALTNFHLQTLSTEECLWRPAAKGLHVHPLDGGSWSADWPEHEGYDLGPSSVAWLTWHLIFWWSMVLDHSLDGGSLSRETVIWPGDADGVRSSVGRLEARWRRMLESTTDDELRSDARSKWPIQNQPFADIVAWANVELAKNAAEIGYVRFLYAARSLPGAVPEATTPPA
jgi:hypothetical protein